MGAAESTSTALQNPEQVGLEVEPKAKTVLNPEQAGAVGQQSSPDIQGKTPASCQPASLFDESSPDYYFLPNLSPTMSSDASTLPDGSAAGSNMVAPEQIGRAIETQSRELQGQGEGEIQNLKQLGGRSTSEALPQVEMLPGAEFLTILEEGVGRIPLSEADLHQSLTEPPAAVPLPPGSTPKFYFLPDSKPAESTSSKPSTEQQTSQLPQDGFDVEAVRRDFPILHQQVHGKPLIWMDNAATSQKPQSVIDTLSQFYEQDNSNVHRGAHTLAARSTNAYEDAREKIQRFLGASLAKEIVFVRGTTEGINLVAQAYGRKHVKAGDEIVLTTLEHHSNIVPWQMLAQEKGAVLKVAPISDQGEILLEEYQKLLSDRTRIVALSHVSNVLGTVLPIKTMAAMAHRHGATVVVDGAQSVPHFRTNVQDLGADFYVFSGHKLFGPTGIGALYGKAALLKEMPPWQGGGNMIESVSFEKTTFNDIPAKFEAGTGNLAAAVGLGAAIDYLNQIGFEAAAKHEEALMAYATAAMAAIPGLRQIGTAAGKVSTLSFTLKNISSEDMGKFLDSEGIAVRAGHHCAQPTLKRFGLTSTVRPSLAFYNTFGEVDKLIAAIKKAKHQLS
ncbi:MAG: SufS family cysteine desulfurase [Moorea sp. SIOASIH]|nr:SufS family cysteine desulfurase [Moorena sp. SIOASIH]